MISSYHRDLGTMTSKEQEEAEAARFKLGLGKMVDTTIDNEKSSQPTKKLMASKSKNRCISGAETPLPRTEDRLRPDRKARPAHSEIQLIPIISA